MAAQNPNRRVNVAALETFPEVSPNIFIHIPKTAGLSIKSMYGINTPFSCVVHHATYKQVEKAAGFEFMKKTTTFACCRNPYTRFASAFSFCQTPALIHNYPGKGFDTEDINKYISKHLKEEDIENNLFFKRQHVFLANSEGHIELDYLMRFEDLDEDWEVISDALYGNPAPLRRHHHNTGSADKHSLSIKSKSKLYSLYKEDFETFNYSK